MVQQSIISTQDKARLKRNFRKDLKDPVGVRLFTQYPSPIAVPGRECPSCPQTRQLIEELTDLSPKLNLEIVDFYGEPAVAQENGVTRIPAIVLGTESGSRVRFVGAPIGYELSTIIEDIMTISKKTSPLRMQSRKQLRAVKRPVHLQVFVTPSSLNCPPMARLAHALAMENENISADVIQAEEFPALARQYNVRTIPLTMINEHTRVPGAVPESELVDEVVRCGTLPEDAAG